MDTYSGSGTITKCELKIFDHPHPSPYREFSTQKVAKLLVAMDTPDGPIWFYSPSANYNMTCPPGAPCVVCTVLENDWIGAKAIADESGKALGDTPVAKIQVGQNLAIEGRFKKDTRFGRQLNYVRIIID